MDHLDTDGMPHCAFLSECIAVICSSGLLRTCDVSCCPLKASDALKQATPLRSGVVDALVVPSRSGRRAEWEGMYRTCYKEESKG